MVQPNWNPGSPNRKGIEHRDVGYGHTTIDAAADVGELQWHADYTGPVDTLELYTGQGAQAGILDSKYNALNRPMLLDLVPKGSEAWGNLSYSDYNVSGVAGSAGMVNENLTTPITASRLNAFDDGLFVASASLNAFLDAQFATAAFPLDRHVLAVEANFRVNLTTGIKRIDANGPMIVWQKDYPAWTSSWASGVARFGECISDAVTGAPSWRHWTPQMIRDFDTSGQRKIRVVCRAGPGYWRIDRLYLRVWWIPERRRGVGIGSPISSLAWVPFTMKTPNATGSPSVTAGEDLTVMARRITDYNVDAVASAVLPWRFMRGLSPDGDWRQHSQAFTPTVSTASNGKSLMPAAGPEIDGILTMRAKASGTVVADSMPYSLSRGALVYGTRTASQRLTMPGGGTIYGQAFIVAGWNALDGRPQAPLRAELYDNTGTKVLNAVEITADDVDRLPVTAPSSNVDDQGASYKTVVVQFPNSSTLAAALYEMRLSSPASTQARPWRVAALIGDDHTTDQTFGGATDYATGFYSSAGAEIALDGPLTSDLLVTLADVPAAVTGLDTAVGSITAHHVEVCDGAGCGGCSDDTMPFVQLDWDIAPSGTPDIAGYQVDRKDDLDPDWQRVATVVGRTTNTWSDHEARIGVSSQYRVRVVRVDNITGAWSTPASANIPTGQVALAFSSNAGVALGCVYPSVWEREVQRSWQFLEAGDVTYKRFYGRNRQVAFRPIERRGDSFTRTVLLDAMCSVALPTMAIFDPLRDLAWAPLPYVCVRDGEGNRWFASLEVPSGANRRADASGTELWLAEIGITEVSDSPAVHDTSVPQVEGPVPL